MDARLEWAEFMNDVGPNRTDGHWSDALVECLRALTLVLEELSAKMPKDPDGLLTAEQLADLFQLSARTLKDQAAAGQIQHHRFGKHYRFSRSDIAEILRLSRQTPRVPGRQLRRVA